MSDIINATSQQPDAIDWNSAAPQPVALLLLDWLDGCIIRGTLVAHRDASGQVHGCRHVMRGTGHDEIVAAWIKSELFVKARHDMVYRCRAIYARAGGLESADTDRRIGRAARPIA